MAEARYLTAEMQRAVGLVVKGRQLAGLAHRAHPRHWIVLGSSFGVPLGATLVTFDDITVAQAAETGDYGLRLLSSRDIARWKRNQLRLYNKATACCAASRWAARSIVDTYGIAPAKVHVVGFGGTRMLNPFERDWSAPSFLFVGSDWHRKNGERVVRAFSRLRADLPGVQLHVVGNHPPLDLPGVTAHGYLRRGVPEERERLESLLRTATCFVMPSLIEPFGNAYVDAGQAGLPSIGTTVGGAADAIGRGGITIDPCSEQQLYEAMRMLASPNVVATMGRAAQSHSRLFTWQKVVGRLLHAIGVEIPGGHQPTPFLSS
jgi:glycosyltransferase involved in cell wall biosynthesis